MNCPRTSKQIDPLYTYNAVYESILRNNCGSVCRASWVEIELLDQIFIISSFLPNAISSPQNKITMSDHIFNSDFLFFFFVFLDNFFFLNTYAFSKASNRKLRSKFI